MMRLAVGLSSLLSCFSARGDSSAFQAKSLHRFIKADGLSAACEDILSFGLKGVGEFQFIQERTRWRESCRTTLCDLSGQRVLLGVHRSQDRA